MYTVTHSEDAGIAYGRGASAVASSLRLAVEATAGLETAGPALGAKAGSSSAASRVTRLREGKDDMG